MSFKTLQRPFSKNHNLDCLHYPKLSSLLWLMALKHTKIELDMLTDSEAYLMIENSIGGGISAISNRYCKAINTLVEGYDPSQFTTFITYLDANKLYGHAQSQPLPVGDFRFLLPNEIDPLDLMSIPEDSDVGYIFDCDLEYPIHLHDSHSDYLLAPEHLTVTREMLSPFAEHLADKSWRPSEKLIPNLYGKTHYVSHYATYSST